MYILFGLDLSHHQDLALDLARCKREGITFVGLKATEGAYWNDPEFAINMAEAKAAGLLVFAYHYQRSDASIAAQVANIRDSVPLDMAVVIDVEENSGDVDITRMLVHELRSIGYVVPFVYIPRWYWQKIGSPSLAGLPPLWSSRYPDRIVGTLGDEWDDVPPHYWDGYGGLGVALLQFTSSVSIAGHQPIDANAYRGTREQLAALLGGREEDMSLSDEYIEVYDQQGIRHPDVSVLKAIQNIFGMVFYGSPTPPWAGPSIVGHLKDLNASTGVTPVELTDAQLDYVATRVAERLRALRFEAAA